MNIEDCKKHIPAFDLERARGMSSEEVKKHYPRFEGRCECGFAGAMYASLEHYYLADY